MIDVLEARRLMAGTATFTVAFDGPDRVYEDYYAGVRGTLASTIVDATVECGPIAVGR